jgi:hypothetical protein
MDSTPDDRARLARDLELLSIIGDPTRGPLASLYQPAVPPVAANPLLAPPEQWWRRLLAAAICLAKRSRLTQSTPHSQAAVNPLPGHAKSRRGVRERRRLLLPS